MKLYSLLMKTKSLHTLSFFLYFRHRNETYAMKHIVTAVLICLSLTSAHAQIEKLSGHANFGYIIGFTDYTSNNYSGADPNLAINAGLGYMIYDNLRLRGDLMLGMLNGNNNVGFFQTTIFEPRLALEYNVLPLISDNNDWVVNIIGGVGLTISQARSFRVSNRQLITESPQPTGTFMSPNAMAGGGFNIGYNIHNNMQINLGFEGKLPFNQDYLDATKSGQANDLYSMINLGVVFNLKTNRDKSKIEVDPKVYSQLKSDIDSLAQVAEAGDPQRVSRLEMETREKSLRIRTLEAKVDSLENIKTSGNVASIANDGTTQPTYNGSAITQSSISEPAYRIVVVSMPSEARAQDWINRSSLDKNNMLVVYVENLNTFRVVYNSYPSFAAAKKDLPMVRTEIPDAWIIKF